MINAIECIVIGYGNSLRSDDGIGLEVARIVANWSLPHVRSLALPQLTPELAVDLAEVDLAIFVDACLSTETSMVELRSLKPTDSTNFKSHFSDPQGLLSLTQALFGNCPQAWWVLVPGVDFQLGDRLTPTGERNIELASIQIKTLLTTNNYPLTKELCTKSASCKIL